ncbi:hypothetical protein UFOVP1382_94 [uncultured Caudovirales phage]|uniref:Uncharacterized protein n=1 Tax=uncultured Caudovirales phage TaxID=2100421 RepID=A0A6J5S3D3_9CAUD|nr:hypothetical protein UFOVP1382_94 [uncultured Caudovirales phage]
MADTVDSPTTSPPRPALRRIEKLVDGAWVVVRMRDLRRDDRFRISESDGEPTLTGTDITPTTEHVATSDAYPCDTNGQRALKALAASMTTDPAFVTWGIEAERMTSGPRLATSLLPAAADIDRHFNQDSYKRRPSCKEDCPWVYPPDDDGAPCPCAAPAQE